ncbi:antitoxin VbhA family protein [Aeromicrobium phragmitis]|uniref:antitoxin VbhA family protein n=1 Tax=Aeromicrobium phragmitis TaxID=2478914 RepID=UPI001AA03104|nr:antitoxin VbhA family protein [Aeromicrobium phragmitis]
MAIESAFEQGRRRRAVDDARRSSELEGSRSTDATRADQDAYVRGEIDINQLGKRVRSRYGLA